MSDNLGISNRDSSPLSEPPHKSNKSPIHTEKVDTVAGKVLPMKKSEEQTPEIISIHKSDLVALPAGEEEPILAQINIGDVHQMGESQETDSEDQSLSLSPDDLSISSESEEEELLQRTARGLATLITTKDYKEMQSLFQTAIAERQDIKELLELTTDLISEQLLDSGERMDPETRKLLNELSSHATDISKLEEILFKHAQINDIKADLENAIRNKDSQEIEKAIKKATLAKSDPKELLEQLVNKLEEENRDPISCAFAKNVLAKFDALKQLWETESLYKLDPCELLKICAVGEIKLQEGHVGYVKKTDKSSHSLLIDPKNKTITLLLKKRGPINEKGSGGKVQSAIELSERILPQNKSWVTAEHIVQKVNLDGAEMDPTELEYEARYGGLKTMASYFKGRIEKTTFTMKKMEYSLFTLLYRKKIKISLDNKLKILAGIAASIEKMHGDGVVHYDIKLENCMCNLKTVDGKLIDFGFSFNKTAPFQNYGTVEYISPEVLLNPSHEYTIEQCCAQDMYAFGVVLYELLHKESSPWEADLSAGYREGDEISKNSAYKKQMAIGETLKSFQEKIARQEELTSQEELDYLFCRLCDPNPETRMKIGEFQQEIARIRAKI